MTRKYVITLIEDHEGVSAGCPALPGCHSQGTTVEEAVTNIQDAIREYLEVWGEPEAKVEFRELELALA